MSVALMMEQQRKHFLADIKKEVVIMKKVKMEDLARDTEISSGELKLVKGGLGPQPEPPDRWRYAMLAKFNYLKWTRPILLK